MSRFLLVKSPQRTHKIGLLTSGEVTSATFKRTI